MKKVISILLLIVMVAMPLDFAFGRGGGGDRRGGGAAGGAFGASDRRARARKARGDGKAKARQARRDLCENKDACRDNCRR